MTPLTGYLQSITALTLTGLKHYWPDPQGGNPVKRCDLFPQCME